MNNIKIPSNINKSYTLTYKKDYARAYYLRTKKDKKDYWTKYYKNNQEYIKEYQQQRKPTKPTEFSRIIKEVEIIFT